MSAAADSAPAEGTRSEERRAMGTACGAHALHDGYTDLVIVMLPIWQAEFGLSYAAVGALRGVLAGTMASFQIPSGMLSERIGTPLVLAGGTALAGLAYCLALFAGSFPALIAVSVPCGARRQHAASARLLAGGARVLRRALAESARHLQFRWRSRKDGDPGRRRAHGHDAAVARDAGADRRGGCSWLRLRCCCSPRATGRKQRRPIATKAATPSAGRAASMRCSRSA